MFIIFIVLEGEEEDYKFEISLGNLMKLCFNIEIL